MRLLCVQCLKMNDVSVAGDVAGKVRVNCPECGFVTVVTRRPGGKKRKPEAAEPAAPAAFEEEVSEVGPTRAVPSPDSNPFVKEQFTEISSPEIEAAALAAQAAKESSAPKDPEVLYNELFDGSIDGIGDWMVRHLDGSERGPFSFDQLKVLIGDGEVGKIDEVRRMNERYVPAAFHEDTAELFDALGNDGLSKKRRT